ncbi:antitoxin PrlF [Methylomarinovum tepidoasis]|uniref:Antitoxin PrlF n=1 Tax=Methylomarinovum tepidoasis TaxID=2840183 RepID=A0AAU9CP55_9GAMM|nr:AbrB/MazE/SpoVT family DNA-binding domain-containing protein [Methylomarinovum sp. IN45]BCX89422.1 antitoxin PrlF [Methylomarinovum sp. IN45]
MQSILTSKGQVTIPKSIRDALKMAPGDKIEFILRDGEVILVPLRSVRSLKGMLPAPERPVSLEEMEQAVEQGRGRV